jgi:hypothetical protein
VLYVSGAGWGVVHFTVVADDFFQQLESFIEVSALAGGDVENLACGL